MSTRGHPWRLVAPWYRWRRQIEEESIATSPRTTRPILQKFDTASFVQSFLKDPQRSLRFMDDLDRIFTVNLIPAPVVAAGSLANKAVTIFRPKLATPPPEDEKYKKAQLVPTSMRKLYLDTHRRHYLVVCQLHCDAAGFPRVSSDEVCQAGFVVRRRHLQVPRDAKRPGFGLLSEIIAIEAKLAELDQTAPTTKYGAKKRADMVLKLKQDGLFEAKRQSLAAQLLERRQQLKQWKDDSGVEWIHEGWVPGQFERVGSWQIVEETPAQLVEAIYPLFPLAANPDVPGHDAEGSTIYFGVVPTSALETDRHGTPRFDSDHVFELRCFVRRHKADCPRTEQVPDCHGELVWSQPTEPYRLAAPSDLIGTSNFPITIQVPRLDELAAQAALAPKGRFSPVRVVRPEALLPILDGAEIKSGSVGGAQICFFAIPLITIVALFVLQIFLPIIVFLFGLWFLLVFKFCIPPSISIDAGLQAELETMGELGVNVEADLSVQASLQVGFGIDTALELNTTLKNGIADYWESEEHVKRSDAIAGMADMANEPLVTFFDSLRSETKLPDAEDPTGGSGRQVGPDLLAGLEYEPREPRWVIR